MIEIAGITPHREVNGRLMQAVPVKEPITDSHVHIDTYDAIVRPDTELYTREDVLEIIKRYEWFGTCVHVAEEAGKSEEEAIGYAKYILKNEYDGYYWNGIDEFMKLELTND